MKRLLFTVAAFWGASVWAQAPSAGWVHMATSTEGDRYSYHEPTRVKGGSTGEVWVLGNFERPAKDGSNSAKYLYSVDCRARSMGVKSQATYSKPWGNGLVVGTFDRLYVSMGAVVPGSIGESVFAVVCDAGDAKPRSAGATSDIDDATLAEFSTLDRSYPGWFEHLDSREFKSWLSRQPAAIRREFSNAQTAEQLLRLVNLHQASMGKRTFKLQRN